VNNTETTLEPATKSRGRVRRFARPAVIAGAAAAALAMGVGTASADTFSPYLAPQVYRGYFGNCTITSGPVKDPYQTSYGFAAIGGGRLQCATPHSYQIWVQEYFSTTGVGASYYQRGATGYYSNYGYGFTGILETGRGCGNGHWFTRVTVASPGYQSLYFDSYASAVNARGVSAQAC
jgi:hypothetical protein